MDERTRSCTWDDFCEYLALFSEDDDFVLVAQEMDLDLGPLKDLPKEKVLISSDSDPNMILNAAGLALDTLSMGMSDDLEAAIAEGSTLVRVGTAIFGSRR